MTWIWRTLAAVAVLLLLFPPFHAQIGSGEALNRGYHFLFAPPTMTDRAEVLATVNVPLLLIEYVALGLIALFLWLANRR